MAGASLTIDGGSLGAGMVAGGLGGYGAGNGQAFGGGLFLQGDETVTLAPASGRVETISGVIADQTGSGGTGAGSLILDGAGTLALSGVNGFTGGVTIDEGALKLANSAAAGSGPITFANGHGALELDSGVYLTNLISGFGIGKTLKFLGYGAATLPGEAGGGAIDMTSSNGGEYVRLKSGSALGATISGFARGDAVDFEAVPYAAGDTATYAGGVVSIDNSAGATIASLDVSGTYAAANFHVGGDLSGDLLISYASAAAARANAANEVGWRSPADLLGSYDSRFAEPQWARASDLTAFDSWSALTPSAGTDHGLHHETYGSAGAARDAWGVAPGWDGPVGHGPGS
jgi:autotransporter-associated beta strand protein